ncbi:MAG: stage II sporulation protein M [Candidatus Dormibacteria bacterium]
MTLEHFTATRQQRWEALEALLRGARRGRLARVPASDLERFGNLCRQAASDLAIARRDHPDSEVTAYLNDLCARAHPLLTRPQPLRPSQLWDWFALGVPRAWRARRAYILASLGLLAAGVLAGWIAVLARPDLRASLIPASGFDQLARGAIHELPAAPLLGTVIITNNVKVAAVAFLGGALAGVPTALILAANGWMLGTIAAAVHEGGYDLAFWSLIVPHGVLELSIIVIAGACGLYVGDALLRPGLRRRGDAFTRAALATLGLAAGSALLLVVAGLLESFVSPSDLPAAAKLAIGAGVGALLYAWLLLGGREPRRAPVTRLDSAGAALDNHGA